MTIIEKDSEFEGLLSNLCNAAFYCGEYKEYDGVEDYSMKMDSLKTAQGAIRDYHKNLTKEK